MVKMVLFDAIMMALMLMLILEVVEVQVAWESAALWVNPGLIRPILTGDPEK